MPRLTVGLLQCLAFSLFPGLAAAQSLPIRINAGGGAYVDSLGRSWKADTYYVGSSSKFATTQAISGTVDDPLYQTDRFGKTFSYQIPVANGPYEVDLHFAEVYWTAAGKRVFDVTVEGVLVLDNLDLWSVAGAKAALVKTVAATVADGVLTIGFSTVVDNAKISAIDVRQETSGNRPPTVGAGADQTITLPTDSVTLPGTASDDGLPDGTLTVKWSVVSGPGAVTFGTPAAPTTTATFASAGTYALRLTASDGVLSASDDVTVTVNATATASTIRINAGGGAYVDSLGRSWKADTYYVGSSSKFATTQAISGTVDDPLYQTDRFGKTFSYQIPAANGPYEVDLHFAEVYWTAAGKRVFDVTVEGVLVLDNLDLWSVAGAKAALVKTVAATVADGVLTIGFSTVVDNAKISAIDVRQGTSGNRPPTVGAGADQTITLPTNSVTLPGTASDDGLPDGMLTVKWSVVSGPGAVTFGTPAAPTTTATFASAGTYALRLTASDGVLSASDDVTVTVNATATASTIRINAGGGAYVDSLGRSWMADTYYVGSSSKFATTQAISGTVDDPLYQTERFGTTFSYQIPVADGPYEVDLHFAEVYWTAAGKRVFDVTVEGVLVLDNLDLWSAAGAKAALVKTVAATVADGVLTIGFSSVVDSAKISAIDVRPHVSQGDPFLHVLIDAPAWVVDYKNAGSVDVALKGSSSHTHEPGRKLVSWVWTEGSTTLGTTPDIVTPVGLGAHTIALTIADDNSPPRTLTGSVDLDVFPITAVGGALARYYPAGGTSLDALLETPPPSPGFVEVLPTLQIVPVGGKIGNSPFSTDVLVVMTGDFHAPVAGTYAFALQGGNGTRLYLNGVLVNGPVSLDAGAYSFEARFAVSSTASLPAAAFVQINGASPVVLDKTNTTHDQSALAPFINSLTGSSHPSGGGTVTLNGIGFFPSGSVTVFWGGVQLAGSAVVVTPDSIVLLAPPGTGTVGVAVVTPNGSSNSVSFTYLAAAGGVPIDFVTQVVAAPIAPTQAAWGPDHRLYVGSISGHIHAYTFDANYAVTAVQTISALSGLSTNGILGIAFNPFDAPNPVKIYVAHTELYANGGSCFSGASPYPGQVSILAGPSFSSVQPLVTGLPTSNRDHGVNGLAFDSEGDLLIAIGGNTNAGVEHCNLGGLPESPLSAAILKARISKAGFNGTIAYRVTTSGALNTDQTSGNLVDVASGVDVAVHAAGLRNPFDIVWTTRGRLYGTDNGPNATFGPVSTSATTQTAGVTTPDEILSLVEGHYYGHPNRNRGRRDDRQNIYRSPSTATLLGVHTAQLATVPSSTDGIEEYRSMAFNGALRGNLLVQHWDSSLYRAVLADDGRSITTIETVPGTSTALDVLGGPGGAIIGIDYSGNAVKVSLPQDVVGGTQAYDIFPWRARPDTSATFVVGGVGFGSAGGTSVTIGGVPATITSVSPTRVHGIIPATTSPTSDLLDVVVQSGGATSVIPGGFRYVLPRGTGTGRWLTGPLLPSPMGEVAGGIINGVLYLVGHSSPATLAYDLAQQVWISNLPQRPFKGDRHAVEVVDGKLYLFGGLGSGSEGKVQIFNPYTQQWTLGANMLFASGSASTALIAGKVYVAGGIVGSTTVAAAAVYDPVTNVWTSIAPMPQGRNHAASGTDGRLFYVFGGRGPGSGDGNFVAEGFDDVQIYDPVTDRWTTSSDPGSMIAPLPQKRGGMGKAAFFGGEFYVIGGETTSSGTGQVAGNVYNRVDVYDSLSNTWRQERPLPTARHGIFPLAYDGKIFVAGGGIQAGHSQADILEVFSR